MDLVENFANEKARLPDLDILKLFVHTAEDDDILKFLKFCLPSNLEKLGIDFKEIDDVTKANIYSYFKSLKSSISRVTDTFCIANGQFKGNDLACALFLASHLSTLIFDSCTFTKEKYDNEFEFDNIEVNLETIRYGKLKLVEGFENTINLDIF